MVLRSKAVRAEVCWQGRHEMRAVMLSAPVARDAEGEVGADEETEMRFSPEGTGARVMSMSCHQSSSTALLTPLFWNHWFESQQVCLEMQGQLDMPS